MEKGLSVNQAHHLLQSIGKNEVATQTVSPPLFLFFSQFPTFINGILTIAAFSSFITSQFIDGFFILAILLINALFGFFQQYRAEKSLEKLKQFTSPLSRVIRDGKEHQIPSSELVPGDIVVLSEGERIPADGKLHLVHHLEVDESVLTGESLPVIKNQGDLVFLGTLITKGKGHVTIERTGLSTRFGQITQTLSKIETDKTPLEKNLATLGKLLSLLIVFIAALIIPLGILQETPLVPLLFLAGSVAVAAIPEGLPAVITIALAIGTHRMAKQKAIVRSMPAIETLGSMQVVLVDKTGTLTQNNMQVKEHFVAEQENFLQFLQACVLGNTASLVKKIGNPSSQWDIVGDTTDGALLLWAHSQKENIDAMIGSGTVVDEYVFDTQTKTITTVWKKDDNYFVFVRGAPEEILSKSKLDEKEKEKIISLVNSYAKEGLRVIALGVKHERHLQEADREHLERQLNFLGLIGIYDPPRQEAAQAIHLAKKAGIQTVMVTGDNEITALAIAKEIGLVEKDEDVITGDELEKLTDEKLEQILLKTRIFARAKPHDKLRLVSMYKKLGYIVGVTGDGVNDALALKKADVGVSMGKSGTDVAKEASDIILLDDNFSTLIKAVEEGRTIYKNILKAITYLLSGNLSELALVFFAVVLGLPPPLLPTQILWINIVTDGLPALALASDTKDQHILKLMPRDPKEPILNSYRLRYIIGLGLTITAFLLVLFFILLQNFSENAARAIVFHALIISHLFIAFVIRGQSIFKVNRFLLISVGITLILQIAVSTIPLFKNILHLNF